MDEKCKACKVEKATIFYNEYNRPTQDGLCELCYERAIRSFKAFDDLDNLDSKKFNKNSSRIRNKPQD